MPTALISWRRTPPPFLIGGAEVTQQLLAEQLAAAGWRVVYLGAHQPPWDGPGQLTEITAYLDTNHTPHESASGVVRYWWNGVDCIAVAQDRIPATLASLLTDIQPDVVFTSQEGSADIAAETRTHTFTAGICHSVSGTGLGVLAGRPHVGLAVSEFVRHRAGRPAGTRVALWYPPFTQPGPGTVNTDRADGPVLMINPIPAKGSRLMHGLIQAMPEERFTLVEGWWNTAAEFRQYPNVTYVPRVYDMAPLYRSHRLLLVPSVVEDAFPRVIIEAALHGVPTIGTDRGGIPEAVGAGGTVLRADADLTEWAAAIRAMNHRGAGERARLDAARYTRPILPEIVALGLTPT
ncbi:glycosyltransferase [Streptomyces goshikiensis]|uniref:glycosyltransferase n=1 Tax=Streptomyces goshikiensis TaxID=1942 RepID=UPI0033AAF8A1